VVVTTDSEEIAAVARSFGAETPFLRPAELSDNHTPTAPVVAHALDWLAENEGCRPDYALCIYATNPFVRASDIRRGFELISERRVSTVFTVTTFSFPIFRSPRIREDGFLEMNWPEYEMTRSQDLPEAVHDAGQYWWLEVGTFLKTRRLYNPDALPLMLPRWLVQDIDTPEDWQVAEFMYEALTRTGTLE
jgi:pseudaminic acid cytidylyltransferase